ncbi:NAD(P)-binding protein [Chloroflexota bacterium]
MEREFDIVVAGAGHNGLIVGAYLAKAGLSVCIVEKQDKVGGGTITRELTLPGFKHDPASLIQMTIQANPLIHRDELGLLSKYGLKYIFPDPACAIVFPDNRALVIYRDIAKTCKSIEQFSKRDAEMYPKFCEASSQILKAGNVTTFSPVPTFGEKNGEDMVQRTKLEVPEKLRTIFAGLTMRSPIGVAPVGMPEGKKSAITPELHAEILLKHVEAGAGFVYIPGTDYITQNMLDELKAKSRTRDLTGKPGDSRWMKLNSPESDPDAIYHIVFPSTEPPERRLTSYEKWGRMIQILKKQIPDNVPIICCVSPLGAFPESATESAKKARELGADIIEINISKGSSAGIAGSVDYYLEKDFPLINLGLLVGDHPDVVVKIAREVVKAVDIPVGVKLSPETGFPRIVGLARELKQVGVKYIHVFNHTGTPSPPDIYNRGKPLWKYVDGNPFSGTTGGGFRTILYKDIAAIAKFCPGIDIAAAGGLMRPEHIIEALMLGANLTQFCTAMLMQGRVLLRNTVEFLDSFMKKEGYGKIDDFQGLGVQYIKPMDQLDMHTDKIVAEVDLNKCNGSGICWDNICVALSDENGRAKINSGACSGCGLCVINCPNGAISLKVK